MSNDQDFKYVLQDFSNVYIGARLSYEELVEQDDTPQRLTSAVYQYILKETDKSMSICEHLLQISEGSMSFMVYKQLKAKIKVVYPKTVLKKEKAVVEYQTNMYSVSDFVLDEQLMKKTKPGQISEISFKKLYLSVLGV